MARQDFGRTPLSDREDKSRGKIRVSRDEAVRPHPLREALRDYRGLIGFFIVFVFVLGIGRHWHG